MKCDVLVVGAGPAGSMAAKTAAENDIDVILIERNEKIGEPVRCAEGINKFLFQDTGIKKDDSFIEQKIDGTKIYFYDEIYELNTRQWQGYTIDRKIFDKYLADNAEASGVKLFTSTKAVGMKKKGKMQIVKIKSDKGLEDIEAKIVIGADGFEYNIGRWAGIKKKQREYAKCLEFNMNCPNLTETNKFHMAFGEEFSMGYAWVFPKNKTANVGVGVAPKASAKNALNFFIKDYPGINSLLGKNRSVLEIRGGGIPMDGPRSIDEMVSDGVILAGDAAGIVDPITGEGITPSMLSGISAGEVASISIEKEEWNKNALSIYDKVWRSKNYLGDVPLGEDLDILKDTKELFYDVFTQKDIPKEARKTLISMMSQVETEDIYRSIGKIKDIMKKLN